MMARGRSDYQGFLQALGSASLKVVVHLRTVIDMGTLAENHLWEQ
jgi:hypothetical protein